MREDEQSVPGWEAAEHGLEFYRDPVAFFEKRRAQHQSRIFNARVLLKQTTFVGCNRAVRELFDKSESFAFGYEEYFGKVYGDVLVFADGPRAQAMRSALAPLFAASPLRLLERRARRLIADLLAEIDTGSPLPVYSMFKRVATKLMICLLLDVSPADGEFIEKVASLSTTHWHGIISVPLNLRVPLIASTSYRKAIDAHTKLGDIVRERLSGVEAETSGASFLPLYKSARFDSEAARVDHLVLLVSALVPKAVASLLTSAVLCSPLWTDCLTDGALADEAAATRVLLETARMWPPFVGGRRRTTERVQLAGRWVPRGQPVVWLATAAGRDPAVFAQPDVFRPSRWLQSDQCEPPPSLLYGGGARRCVGAALMDICLKELLVTFVDKYRWQLTCASESDKRKWLPVSRPIAQPLIRLTAKTE